VKRETRKEEERSEQPTRLQVGRGREKDVEGRGSFIPKEKKKTKR